MPKPIYIISAMSLLVLLLWQFPRFWYVKMDPEQGRFWLEEQKELADWEFTEIPVSESAENLLVADDLFNGQFIRKADGVSVLSFNAKRYSKKQDEIGLFVHTPDRCWTQNGWKIEAVSPDTVDLNLHGLPMVFERRIFNMGSQRQLVYFGGLVGGQALPYRLDHNLSIAMKFQIHQDGGSRGAGIRAVDTTFWGRIWDGFINRRPLIGPKQFVRISTPVAKGKEELADKVLHDFVSIWLKPTEY